MDLQTDYNLFNPYPSYHNTTDSKGVELAIYEGKAKGQEQIVKSFFEERPEQKFTSEEVWKILIGRKLIHDRVPKDSIKRAISNLKKKGKLIRTDEMTIGEYNAPLHYYKLNKL